MREGIHLTLIALLVAAVITSESLGANFSVPPGDGWYTWQVEAADGSDLELFALMASGQPVKFRARGKTICFTDSTDDAVDLGRVDPDQSINWLQNHIYPANDLSQGAIILISLHAGELPVDILEQLLAVE